jgi:hypothetical protein
MNAPSEPSPPLNPDDPRLSEWIDGRLSPPEAAAVERAVNRSPELARLVADLRAVKAAARQATAASPPPGFADRVMAAVVADKRPPDDAASDRLVAAEWRAIEAERIAEERAEAAADLADEIAPARVAGRRPWPWLTIATALAAGLLATVVLNFPPRGPDEVQVALETDRAAEPLAENEALRSRASRTAAESKPAAAPPARAAAVAAREPQRPAENRESLDKADELAEPIEVMVRGPEGRAKLFERFAALRLVPLANRSKPRGRSESRELDKEIGDLRSQGLGAGAGGYGGGEGPAGDELFELVGPEEAVAAFLADPLGERPLAKGLPVPGERELLAERGLAPQRDRAELSRARAAAVGLAGEAKAKAEAEAEAATDAATDTALDADLDAAAPARRILVRVIQLPAAAGEPSEP